MRSYGDCGAGRHSCTRKEWVGGGTVPDTGLMARIPDKRASQAQRAKQASAELNSHVEPLKSRMGLPADPIPLAPTPEATGGKTEKRVAASAPSLSAAPRPSLSAKV